MHTVKVKIVHAAWARDNTWPPGAVAPESDDILLDNEPPSDLPQPCPPLPTPAAGCSPGILNDGQSGRREDE